jgi:alpha-tubulin suppressor-like RCC1 family protein
LDRSELVHDDSNCFVWGGAKGMLSFAADLAGDSKFPGFPSLLAPAPSGNLLFDADADPELVDVCREILDIDFGQSHGAFVTGEGEVYAFGAGKNGELGTGEAYDSVQRTPVRMNFDGRAVSVKCGRKHTVILTEDGEVATCGWGGDWMTMGGLGTGETNVELEPVYLSGIEGKVVQIAVGDYHTMAVTEAGQLFVWGRGDDGRLGTGGTGGESEPIYLETFGGENMEVAMVSAGPNFSACVTKQGKLYTWGANGQRQLAVPIGMFLDQTNLEPIPTEIVIDPNESEEDMLVRDVSCGQKHMVVVTQSGRAYTWGDTPWTEPQLVRGDNDGFLAHTVAQAAAGNGYSLLVDVHGRVFSVGSGSSGCLGLGSKANIQSPLPIKIFAEEARALHVTAGYSFAGAIVRNV